MKRFYLLLSLIVFVFHLRAQNTFPSSGRVGIGTTSPASQLTLSGDTGRIVSFGIDAAATQSISSSFANSRAQFGYNGNTSNAVVQGGGGKGIEFNVDNSSFGTGQAMVIRITGRVGIGTTSPNRLLEVFNNTQNIGNPTIRITGNVNTASNTLGTVEFYNNNSGNTGLAASIVAMRGSGITSGELHFFTEANSSNFLDRMVIDRAGNVGIGTITPSTPLEINGTMSLQLDGVNVLSIQPNVNVNGSSRSMRFANSSISTTEGFQFYNANNTSSLMMIQQNGKVGIGTNNPDSKLSVTGAVHAQEVLVDMTQGADYVFADDYKLPSLKEVKAYVEANHHLAEIPSAKEMETNGLKLGEMNKLLLKKVEELTLYLIEKDKAEQEQKEINKNLSAELKSQQGEIDHLKQMRENHK